MTQCSSETIRAVAAREVYAPLEQQFLDLVAASDMTAAKKALEQSPPGAAHQNAIDAMAAINASSRQIVDIIGVIDEIECRHRVGTRGRARTRLRRRRE